jgi:CPA1 family monovalent cation:H+ antiporter
MFILDSAALLLSLAALFGLINHHFFRLPFGIGLLLSGLLSSMGVLVLDSFIPHWELASSIRKLVLELNFADAVLSGMLSLLLFAGALHTDFARLRKFFTPILSLAVVGTLISTFTVGLLAWGIFRLLSLEIPLPWCFVFGALISPTDPIAVLGILKAAHAPPELEVKVIGESLLNDGVGVVIFTVLLTLASSIDSHISTLEIAALLAKEILGGVTLGLAMGLAVERALQSLDEPNLEILITLAAVLALGWIAARLHVSAPLAAVVAGLLVGNRGRKTAMSARTESALDTVWSFLDEALNAVLFLLIGIEVFAIDYSRADYLWAALGMIPATLLGRFAGVAGPVALLRSKLRIGRGTVRLLTWGGLKGGISIALAMKLPDFPGRNALLTITYAVVIFSIIGQGLTVGPLIRRLGLGQTARS